MIRTATGIVLAAGLAFGACSRATERHGSVAGRTQDTTAHEVAGHDHETAGRQPGAASHDVAGHDPAAHHARHTAPSPAPGHATSDDTAFTRLQERGRAGMAGVDQYRSTHRFDSQPDGGRIEFVQNDPDGAAIAAIRTHLREIAAAFARGDFDTPAFIHAGAVPGTDVMRERRDRIRYTVQDLPDGAELLIRTDDPEALQAIHAFMAFQRADHRTGGRTH